MFQQYKVRGQCTTHMWPSHLAPLVSRNTFLHFVHRQQAFSDCTVGVVKLKANIFVPAGELPPQSVFLFALADNCLPPFSSPAVLFCDWPTPGACIILIFSCHNMKMVTLKGILGPVFFSFFSPGLAAMRFHSSQLCKVTNRTKAY